MSPEGGPGPGLERMIMRELRDLLVSPCSAQPARFGSVLNTRVNSQVNGHSITGPGGAVAATAWEPARNISEKTKSSRKFACCEELEPGVGRALSVGVVPC